MSIRKAVDRGNSHLRYWAYRRKLRNGGPTLLHALGQWFERVRFELRSNP